MIELPEAYLLAEQINKTLVGKTIKSAAANTHPHGFAWYTGDPDTYNERLAGKKITKAMAGISESICGNKIRIFCEDMLLAISTPIKYHAPGQALPKSHQLLLEFDDSSHMSCTVQMWGGMLCLKVKEDGELEGFVCNNCASCGKDRPNPLMDEFDENYFNNLWQTSKQNLSAKAFLATEQRIPGLGNGVLQDILFNAGIHPKRRLDSISKMEKDKLFNSIKSTLKAMFEQGGRDTEKDLFGKSGGYKTILSKSTLPHPCPGCSGTIERKSFLGGNIYYCPVCQPLA